MDLDNDDSPPPLPPVNYGAPAIRGKILTRSSTHTSRVKDPLLGTHVVKNEVAYLLRCIGCETGMSKAPDDRFGVYETLGLTEYSRIQATGKAGQEKSRIEAGSVDEDEDEEEEEVRATDARRLPRVMPCPTCLYHFHPACLPSEDHGLLAFVFDRKPTLQCATCSPSSAPLAISALPTFPSSFKKSFDKWRRKFRNHTLV